MSAPQSTQARPAIFTAKALIAARVAHPDMTPTTTTLGGARVEFVKAPLAVDLTFALHAEQRLTIRITDPAAARAMNTLLGAASLSLERAARRALAQPSPAAASRAPSAERSCNPPACCPAATAAAGLPSTEKRTRKWWREYWREIFEHWVETGKTLHDFCAEVGYDVKETYRAFYVRFYKEFIQNQDKLRAKGGRP